MGRERLAERGIRFGRINEGVEKSIPVALTYRQSFAFPDQAVGGFERVVDDESRYRRVRQSRSTFQYVLRPRVDANLDSFGFCLLSSHHGVSVFADKVSQISVHVKPQRKSEKSFLRRLLTLAVSTRFVFVADRGRVVLAEDRAIMRVVFELQQIV